MSGVSENIVNQYVCEFLRFETDIENKFEYIQSVSRKYLGYRKWYHSGLATISDIPQEAHYSEIKMYRDCIAHSQYETNNGNISFLNYRLTNPGDEDYVECHRKRYWKFDTITYEELQDIFHQAIIKMAFLKLLPTIEYYTDIFYDDSPARNRLES